jgi:3-phenylpropionate/trans-cinnamate dioxygenase ferredoxin reductase component
MNQSVVVIGAGQAATEFAVALRAKGFAGAIQIVGDEPYLPYQRPPLSKDFLSGKSPYEKLMLRPEASGASRRSTSNWALRAWLSIGEAPRHASGWTGAQL